MQQVEEGSLGLSLDCEAWLLQTLNSDWGHSFIVRVLCHHASLGSEVSSLILSEFMKSVSRINVGNGHETWSYLGGHRATRLERGGVVGAKDDPMGAIANWGCEIMLALVVPG